MRRKGEPSPAVLDREFPHQISIPDDWIKGGEFYAIRQFADQLGACSRNHNFCHRDKWHTVFRFRDKGSAEKFKQKYAGEWFDPKRRGRGKRWHLLRDEKGRYNPLKEFFQSQVSWQTKLSAPIVYAKPSRGEMKTLADARGYILDLQKRRGEREHWQRATKLLMEAADGGDVEAATKQVRFALMMDGALKI